MTHSDRVRISTHGNTHVLDITESVARVVADSGIREGILRSLMAADADGERSRAALQRMREQDV